jgi:membrane-bound lytic murein transglycosylase D
VLRQANNIPQKTVLKAGSTILVPKLSTSASVDIAPEVADSATVAFEAERAGKSGKSAKGYKLAKGGKTEAGGVALVKARVPHQTAKSKKRHRNDD